MGGQLDCQEERLVMDQGLQEYRVLPHVHKIGIGGPVTTSSLNDSIGYTS